MCKAFVVERVARARMEVVRKNTERKGVALDWVSFKAGGEWHPVTNN